MKIKNLKLTAVVIAIGLILTITSCFLTGILKTPVITEQDFNYSATYKLNGETKTVEGIYRCRYTPTTGGEDPTERYYEGVFLSGDHILAELDGLQLEVVFNFTSDYLMGDSEPGYEYSDAIDEPYLAVYDEEGCEYQDEEKLALFQAELISWETPQPIENSFVFNGFSRLHANSMLAMLAVGILVIIAIMVAVKKDETVSYNGFDKISIVLNFLAVFVAVPFITLVVGLLALTMNTSEFFYQAMLCIPALTMFTVAASIALRRKGFAKIGCFIQLAGPVLFVLYMVAESIVYNLFY